MFPGQGSQSIGMGAELFAAFPDETAAADETLGYSIKSLCCEQEEQLNQTNFTQPALYVVNALTHRQYLQTNQRPDILIGHSLGEYNALLAADAFDFITGLKIVQRRAELMAEQKGGGMAAVLGISSEQIRNTLDDNNFSDIDIANLNTPVQTVISGPEKSIQAAQTCLTEAGARRVVVLSVSGAFHSRYMESAKKQFESELSKHTFNPLEVPVISNVTATPYESQKIAEHLADQITHPVLWTDTIQTIIDTTTDPEFVEIGPGNVLKGLLKACLKSMSSVNH